MRHFILSILLSTTLFSVYGLAAGAVSCKAVSGKLEKEAEYTKEYPELIAKDDAFVKEVGESTEPYLKLRALAKKQMRSDGDFPFEPHKPILQRLVKDIEQRLHRKFGDKHRESLLKVKKTAEALLAEGPQGNPLYKKTVRFMMDEALPTLDLLLLERYPQLAGKYFHRRNAAHMVEKILAETPDMFVYFSFAWVDDAFFVNSRPSLMNLIGVNPSGLDDVSDSPYGDMFHMLISEFAYHDWGHAEFTTMRDLEYIKKSGKDLDRIVMEWEYTRRRIKSVVDQIAEKDPVLAEAMVTLQFELLRERGFQFSLTVLKQELETEKWTRVLLKKYKAGFYNYYGANKEKFDRLDEARLLLVKAVERFKEEDQITWANTIRAHFVPALITYTPKLGFAAGRLETLEILKSGPAVIHTAQHKTEIRELISAQVHPTETSPFTKTTISKIERVLGLEGVQSIIVSKKKELFVKYKDGSLKPLESVVLPTGSVRGRHFENIEIFEMNQVLGAEERGEEQAFTIRSPTQTYKGTVTLDKNFITGFHTATIKTLDGKTVTAPLVELRIDPL